MAKHRALVHFTRLYTQEEKRCDYCKKKFTGVLVRRYCTRACQNRAYYQRHKKEPRK